jgi:maltose alpha-D-glucosyltransferase / alpha-amylase
MTTVDAHPSWFENAVIYQVPTALLRDSNGNGWGDLRGVRDSLDYIAGLGATAVWLQPIYRSPFVDGGYDVVDHLDVSDRFGTLPDFEDLLARAHELGLRVILDLVVQHTSDEHPWFHAACRAPHSEYHDYYIWSDTEKDSVISPVFPTVEESVWAWSEEAGAYYRHAFYSHEPDLDLGNPKVREEIHGIVRHWLGLGVDGFRVDAVPYMVKTAAESDPRDDGFWVLEELAAVVKDVNPEAVLIAESDVGVDEYATYFGTNRFTMLLNFWMNNHIFLALARELAGPIIEALEAQATPPEGCEFAMWLRNHDELDLEQLTEAERDETMAVFAPHPQMRAFNRGIRRRLGPMLEDPRRRQLAMALLCSFPGAAVLLYGDEIGMGDNLDLPDRASVRTPMQWDSSLNAGFSPAHPSELVHPLIDAGPFGYTHVNVAEQERHPGSLLQTVRHLFEVRRGLGPLRTRDLRTVDVGDPAVLAMLHPAAEPPVLMLSNLCGSVVTVTIPDGFGDDAEEVACDHAYAAPDGDTVTLNGYGYRWFVGPR